MGKSPDKNQLIISIVVALIIFSIQFFIKRQVNATDKRIETNVKTITRIDDRVREIEKKYEGLGGPKDPLYNKVESIEKDLNKLKTLMKVAGD